MQKDRHGGGPTGGAYRHVGPADSTASAGRPDQLGLGDGSPVAPPDPARLAQLYRVWFDQVVKWLNALGAPSADVEDIAQEVFMVTRRRLADFDGAYPAGWLYRIANGQLRQHRRRVWFRVTSAPLESVAMDEMAHERPSALSEIETRQKKQLLDRLLLRMTAKRRIVFLLFEVQGHSLREIGIALGLPINTTKTRLHLGRKDFLKLLAKYKDENGSADLPEHHGASPPKDPMVAPLARRPVRPSGPKKRDARGALV
jgi:RNA polymerase sigma factor (sigma-70 family)